MVNGIFERCGNHSIQLIYAIWIYYGKRKKSPYAHIYVSSYAWLSNKYVKYFHKLSNASHLLVTKPKFGERYVYYTNIVVHRWRWICHVGAFLKNISTFAQKIIFINDENNAQAMEHNPMTITIVKIQPNPKFESAFITIERMLSQCSKFNKNVVHCGKNYLQTYLYVSYIYIYAQPS